MSKTVLNLQDSFLNQVRKEGTEVKVAMLDGTSLAGYVKGFDNFTVIIQSQGRQHMLYKHAISQVVSGKNNRPQQNSSSNTTRKKSAFNPLDLSQVKVEEGEERDTE